MRQVVVTWSGNVPGYGDARPDGRFAVSVPGSHIVTDAGTIPQPDGHPALYITVPPVKSLLERIACAWSDGGPDHAKEWTPSAWVDRGPCCGTNAVIYDLDGTLHISQCELPQGSIGWRYVDADGRLVTCESTYADIERRIFEYTVWPDLRIGQGDEGAVVWFTDLGLRRLAFEALRPAGTLRNIRARRAGDDFAITVVDYDQHLTSVTFASLAELRAMPAVSVPVPDPPPTKPPAPQITILSYFPSQGPAPLRVKAIRGLSGGQAARIFWRARKKGMESWVIVANNPATDPDHHYLFKTPGTYEIGCDVTAPDRPSVVVDGTSKSRVVKVSG